QSQTVDEQGSLSQIGDSVVDDGSRGLCGHHCAQQEAGRVAMRQDAMRKEEKAQAIAELREKFTRARAAFLTECTGLEGHEVTELRRLLRRAHAELKVGKNTLAIRAADGTPVGLAQEHVRRPVSA